MPHPSSMARRRRARAGCGVAHACGLPLVARAAALGLALLAGCTGWPLPDPGASDPAALPRAVRPLHYDVAITPDAQSLVFAGQAAIAIEVVKPTRSITLHAADIEILDVGLSGTLEDEAGFGAATTAMDEAAQRATFTFEKTIPPGRYLLVIDYRGRIATQPYGLFALDYPAEAGGGRALYTQLQSADARRLLPCWDEPDRKATFTLEATIPDGQVAVSNMPVAGTEELGGGRVRVRFAPTPPMSSYLLFFALGDFERVAAQANDTGIGVVTRRGAGAQARFILDASREILHEHEAYFGTPYPLPKLDNVAAPGSSPRFSAMENWGAILTFEHALLLDPAISTPADRQLAFRTAAHEIAHQWFGNLVTMRWWDDVWLNEGFASWMEARTTARLRPQWHTWALTVRARERAMELDALTDSRPVVRRIASVGQAGQAFDAITYAKGAAVIRMLESFVGAETWQAGVRRYLDAHAYGNAVSADLWRAVEAAAGRPVSAIARDFTMQPGVPLVRIDEAQCVEGRTTLELSQGEYTRSLTQARARRWRVPVIAAVPGGAPAGTVLRGKATLTVEGCGPVVVNAGQSGYYRTLYAPAPFTALEGAFATLPPIDQLGILYDAFALGLAGLQPATDVLALVEATPVDADPQVWAGIAAVFESLDDYYRGDDARRARFRAYARARLHPVLAQIGWSAAEPGDDATAVLRGALIATLGRLGDPAVIAEARRLHAGGATPAPLRKAVLSVVARHADAAAWDALHAAAPAEQTPLVRRELYVLLASAEDPALVRRALALAIGGEPGATSGSDMLRAASLSHPDLVWEFALANHDAVMGLVDAPSRSRFLPSLAAASLDPEMAAAIGRYAAARLPADARGDAEVAAARVAWRVRVRAARLPEIDAWLETRPAG